MALTRHTPRTFSGTEKPYLPVKAGVNIYQGAALGVDATGYARPVATGDKFGGFAISRADNTQGSDGALSVQPRGYGAAELNVTGVVGQADLGANVYAVDDATFTLTQGTNVLVGKVMQHMSGTRVMVRFKAFWEV